MKDDLENLKREWNDRLTQALLEFKVAAVANGDKHPSVEPELKVRHKESGLRYTVDSVSVRDITLRTPENEKFTLDATEFENGYELC